MSTWFGATSVTGSLDGFAIGVMMSGACFLAITAPRRARRRQVMLAAAGPLPEGPLDWLRRQVTRLRPSGEQRPAGAFGGSGLKTRTFAEVFGTGAFGGATSAEAIGKGESAGAFGAGAFQPGGLGAGAFQPGEFEAGGFGPGEPEAGDRSAGKPGAPGLQMGPFEPAAFEAGEFDPALLQPDGLGTSSLEPWAFRPVFAADAERVVKPDEIGAHDEDGWASSAGGEGIDTGGHRNRHRLGGPIPGSASPDRAPRGGAYRGGAAGGAGPASAPRGSTHPGGPEDSAFPDSRFPDSVSPDLGFPDVAFPEAAARDGDEPGGGFPPDGADLAPLPERMPPGGPPDGAQSPHSGFPDWELRDAGLPDTPSPGLAFPGGGSHRRQLGPPSPDEWLDSPLPDVPFPGGPARDSRNPEEPRGDLSFPDDTFGTAKRPETRRMPRHAAPAVGLGSRISGTSRWMAGLFGARALAGGARG
jgi:hypothetical protein